MEVLGLQEHRQSHFPCFPLWEGASFAIGAAVARFASLENSPKDLQGNQQSGEIDIPGMRAQLFLAFTGSRRPQGENAFADSARVTVQQYERNLTAWVAHTWLTLQA